MASRSSDTIVNASEHMDQRNEDLETRVQQFMRLELPGQPMMMHMGTSYLVQDLWREVRNLREKLNEPAK